MMADVRISQTFRCPACGTRVLEVRIDPESVAFNARCPICDRDLLAKEGIVIEWTKKEERS